jgi:hypothetical protein
MDPHIFEALMLVCFGAAWPFSIHKMLKTKRSRGKSLPFLIVIFFGYVYGILFASFSGRSAVIFLYLLNASMVIFDIGLTIKYRGN